MVKDCVFALDITFYESFYVTNLTKWQRAEMDYLRLSLNNKFNGFGGRKLTIAVLKVTVLKARFIYVNCITIERKCFALIPIFGDDYIILQIAQMLWQVTGQNLWRSNDQ